MSQIKSRLVHQERCWTVPLAMWTIRRREGWRSRFVITGACPQARRPAQWRTLQGLGSAGCDGARAAQTRRRRPWQSLIAADKDRCSLIDAIESWFSRQAEPDLLALVRKAYDDKRLFLLVDGIDEWDNETAANTAFSLLQAFTERHSIPAIITSRPHGFRLITGLDGSWRVSEIAPFSTDQQTALAKTWFAHLNPAHRVW